MVDKYASPLYTPKEAARYLGIPESTMYSWLGPAGRVEPLVHHVAPERRGWPSIPFVAAVETYVLRSLRDLGLTSRTIREAAAAVRREFDTPYGLATRKIATDGIDIFLHYADDDDLVRARDGQRPIRQIITEYLRYIEWDAGDDTAARLRLRQYPDAAPVILDPRFANGQPVLAKTKTPVEAIVDLWRAGESMDDVADEYELDRDVVEGICRAAA